MLAHPADISPYPRLWMVNKMSTTVTLTFSERNTPGTTVYCGPHAATTINQLMQDMSRNTVPTTSCLYGVYALSQICTHSSMVADSSTCKHSTIPDNFATFFLTMRNRRLCPPSECTKNIACGKCRDEYMVKKFASVLFPQHYGKQKVR